MSQSGTPDAAPQAARGPDVEALARLVTRLAEATTLEGISTALVDAALEVVGGTRAAVLQGDDEGRLHLEHDRGSGLPDVLVIDDLRATLWRVLLGQATLHWSDRAEAPSPLSAHPGWASGIVVLVAGRTGRPRLLAVSGMDDPGAQGVAALQTLAAAAAPVLDRLEMGRAQARARALLGRVTELASGLTTASAPRDLLIALTRGLSAVDDIDAAMVWLPPTEPGEPFLVVGDDDGLAPEMGDFAAARVAGLMDQTTSRAVAAMLSAAGSLPDGRLLTLLPISDDPRRVLGLVHPRALDEDEQRVMSTLIGALDPALRQAEMGLERRSLLATFGRVLRPMSPPDVVDIGIEHHPNTAAADTFGGDFYDWFAPAADRLVVALGDVAGKGIRAAAASSMAVWSFRALGRQGTSPSLIAHLMDNAVAQELGDDRFVTMALVDVDTTSWRIRLVLAGHPAPILVGEDAPPGGLQGDRPLGVLPDGPAFTTHELGLGPGHALVLFTDGAMDAVGATGERLGPDGLAAVVEDVAAQGMSASALASAIWLRVCEHAQGVPDDDCAILVLRRPLA